MFIKKILLYLFSALSIFSFVAGAHIEYTVEDTLLFTGAFSGFNINQSNVWFTYGGNDFGGLFFIKDVETLSIPEIVQLGSVTKTCTKKIRGIYYNDQRGLRFWPLDQFTLSKLQTLTGAYDDIHVTGGLFMDCGGSPSTRVYGDITHTVGGYDYELIAGVEMNFLWNTYLNFGGVINLPAFGQLLRFVSTDHGLFLSGHVFDSYGGIAMVRGSGSCIDVRYPDPSTICSSTTYTQSSNCGNVRSAIGTKSCGGGTTVLTKDKCCSNSSLPGSNEYCIDYSPSYYDNSCLSLQAHNSAGLFCDKYSDEPYIQNGSFIDTTKHRGFNYIEIMRNSCLHRGKNTKKGGWEYYPNDYIKKSEILKTLVKILGVVFDDFTIETEDKTYPYSIIFSDLPSNNRFSWYSEYAYMKGLSDGLYTVVNGKKILHAESYVTRNDIVKKIVQTYNTIHSGQVPVSTKTNLSDIHSSDPYYTYIKQAESLGFIQGVPKANGTYMFEGDRFVTRAEFAKMVSIPFNALLF